MTEAKCVKCKGPVANWFYIASGGRCRACVKQMEENAN